MNANIYNPLTQNAVLNMTDNERIELLLKLQDEACNIDYILYPIESDLIHKNINLLESKILYNEY